MPDLRWIVVIRGPRGDFLGEVPTHLIEESHITLSMPPSDASVIFTAGTERRTAETLAATALALGAESAAVEQIPWPLRPDAGDRGR
jgi:hypothetical protein